jgi:hypothetical protein
MTASRSKNIYSTLRSPRADAPSDEVQKLEQSTQLLILRILEESKPVLLYLQRVRMTLEVLPLVSLSETQRVTLHMCRHCVSEILILQTRACTGDWLSMRAKRVVDLSGLITCTLMKVKKRRKGMSRT